MGGIFSSNSDPTKEEKTLASVKFDCKSCTWKPVAFCADEDGNYDASCHGYASVDPHNSRNRLTTHGYDCIASKEENMKSGLYSCNARICKKNTLQCEESDIPSKPSGGDPWVTDDYNSKNVELNCKEFLENHAKSGAYVNTDFMKNKCGEIFEEQITSDRHEFKKYCDDHFFRYPNSKKYNDIQDCYSTEAPRFASNENEKYCEDYVRRYPYGKYESVEQCKNDNFRNEAKQFCDDHFDRYPESKIYTNLQDCYNDQKNIKRENFGELYAKH
jgi:hypothetical protein